MFDDKSTWARRVFMIPIKWVGRHSLWMGGTLKSIQQLLLHCAWRLWEDCVISVVLKLAIHSHIFVVEQRNALWRNTWCWLRLYRNHYACKLIRILCWDFILFYYVSWKYIQVTFYPKIKRKKKFFVIFFFLVLGLLRLFLYCDIIFILITIMYLDIYILFYFIFWLQFSLFAIVILIRFTL